MTKYNMTHEKARQLTLEIQGKYPFLYLGGSYALVLNGNIKKDLIGDLDFIMNTSEYDKISAFIELSKKYTDDGPDSVEIEFDPDMCQHFNFTYKADDDKTYEFCIFTVVDCAADDSLVVDGVLLASIQMTGLEHDILLRKRLGLSLFTKHCEICIYSDDQNTIITRKIFPWSPEYPLPVPVDGETHTKTREYSTGKSAAVASYIKTNTNNYYHNLNGPALITYDRNGEIIEKHYIILGVVCTYDFWVRYVGNELI